MKNPTSASNRIGGGIRALSFGRVLRLCSGRAAGLLAMCGILTIAGCELPGILVSKTTGQPVQKAIYVPKQEPMLVLVESYGNNGDIMEDAQRVSADLIKVVKELNIAPIVDSDQLEKVRDADPQGYKHLTTDELGRRLGARQVLYLNITSFQVDRPQGSQAMRGRMTGVVRIVDTGTGEIRWPATAKDGQFMAVATNWIATNGDNAESKVHDQTAFAMADTVSKIFHDFQPDSAVAPPVQ